MNGCVCIVRPIPTLVTQRGGRLASPPFSLASSISDGAQYGSQSGLKQKYNNKMSLKNLQRSVLHVAVVCITICFVVRKVYVVARVLCRQQRLGLAFRFGRGSIGVAMALTTIGAI